MSQSKKDLIAKAAALPQGSKDRRDILASIRDGKPLTPWLRKPVYAMTDGVGSLLSGAQSEDLTKRDAQLQKLLKEMDRLKNQVVNHLNKSYIWD